MTDFCDIDDSAPPERLPKYGDLRASRYQKLLRTCRTVMAAKELQMEKKRKKCRAKPMKEACIPESILLPSRPIPENAGRYLEVDAPVHTDPGTHITSLRVKMEDVQFPDWLVELSDGQLQTLIDIKDILSTGKPLCDTIDPLFEAVQGVGSGITEDEVIEIMKRIPLTANGYSFSHFMFIAGSPGFARKAGILREPMPFEKSECEPPPEEDEDGEEADSSSKRKNKDKDEKKDKKDKKKRRKLYENPNSRKAPEDPWPPKEKKEKKEEKFSPRQKLFYSGLLYCELFDTIQQMEGLYNASQSVPEPEEKVLRRNQALGFGISQLGSKKFGFAEWDRPLPPLPKISPYLSSFALVGFRKRYIRPSGKNIMYSRSTSTIQPLYLSIKPPQKPEQTVIKVLADKGRINSILGLMGADGNCMAKLPGVANIFYLGDTLIQRTEDTRPPPDKLELLPKIYWRTEAQWLAQEIKFLYQPHGLPPRIAHMPNMVTFDEGLKLRQICKKIREHHWEYICMRKAQFRQVAWPLMHVDRIPCGNLRENFVYAFETLLPLKSALPIIHKSTMPW